MSIDNLNEKKVILAESKFVNSVQSANSANSDIQMKNINDKSFSLELETAAKEASTEANDKKENEEAASAAWASSVLKGQEAILLKNLQSISVNDNNISSLKSKIKIDNSMTKTVLIDLKKIDKNDLDFFKKLVDGNGISVNCQNAQNNIQASVNEDLGISYKSIEVSKTLNSMIEQAYKTNSPVRIDFNENTSVILRIDKEGKVSADFIPGDKAVELALKNALPQLRAKFDEEAFPYTELKSRTYNENKNKEHNHKEGDKDE